MLLKEEARAVERVGCPRGVRGRNGEGERKKKERKERGKEEREEKKKKRVVVLIFPNL